MPRALSLLAGLVMVPATLFAQVGTGAPTETAAFAVTYVEVLPSARSTAVAALKQYRDASRKDEGYGRVEIIEQIGRPGHFGLIERWADQKALDAHGQTAHTKQLQTALQPIRTSHYDQRPYKPLALGSAPATPGNEAIHVMTHVDIGPGSKADVPGLLKQLVDDSRKDEGNLRFGVLQHAQRANHFTVFETWRDEKALDGHAAAPHTRQYREQVGPLTGSPLDERLYKLVE